MLADNNIILWYFFPNKKYTTAKIGKNIKIKSIDANIISKYLFVYINL
jgi:hypothetical protein